MHRSDYNLIPYEKGQRLCIAYVGVIRSLCNNQTLSLVINHFQTEVMRSSTCIVLMD